MARKNVGAESFEIQLLGELLTSDSKLDFDIVKPYDIVTIHMPLLDGADTPIEYPANRLILSSVCDTAERISDVEGKMITVVAHLRDSINKMNNYGILHDVIESIRHELETHPGVRIALENTTWFETGKKQNIFGMYAPVSLINGQYESCNLSMCYMVDHDRCGTTVDTCHAMMIDDQISHLRRYMDQIDIPECSFVQWLFENCSDNVINVHLSNMAGNGYGYGRHGIPFFLSDDSTTKLGQMKTLIEAFAPNADITAEVSESDYLHPYGYASTKAMWEALSC